MIVKPPKGKRTARAWIGLRVRLRSSFSSRVYKVEAGTLMYVRDVLHGKGLVLEKDPCPCCQISPRLWGISPQDVEELGHGH